jgi:hypothetical protein
MDENPPQRFRKRKITIWIFRVIYAVILMATIDSWSGFFYGHGVFSITLAEMRDGGTTMSVGPGYCMTFWRRMDGKAYGPVIWFWGAPFIVDAAHRGVQVHWIWS